MELVYRLPVVYNTGIVSECWTSYKLAVTLNDRKSKSWLASHFEIYMEDDGWTVFGNNFDAHPLNYFDEILEIQEVKHEKIFEKNIIKTIIDLLNSGKYVAVDCLRENTVIHERMIYGYDLEEAVFFSLGVGKQSQLEEKKVPFEILKLEYFQLLEYLKMHKIEKFMRRNWFYTITTMRLRGNYRNDNAIFEMLKKIFREIHGYKIIREEDPFLMHDDIKVSYTGLSCLKGMATVIKRKGFREHSLTMALVALYEHRVIIQNSLEWFCDEFHIKDDEMHSIINKYKNTIKSIKTLYSLSMKNDICEISGFEEKMIKQLNLQYYKEKEILMNFYNKGIEYLINGEN